MEPHEELALHEEMEERRYMEAARGRTCSDCAECAEPGPEWANPERIGWCKSCGDFVCLDDSPLEIGCEVFG